MSLALLPTICSIIKLIVPLILLITGWCTYQMISEKVVRNLLESSTKLRVLCLYSCLGNLTSFSFQIKAPLLRILRLEWITPWMTNDDLAVLIQNYNLVELSLSGCKLLDSSKFYFRIQYVDHSWCCWVEFFLWSTDSQELISSGWPNLTCLHLEVYYNYNFLHGAFD